jgi:hypothetical protein
MLLKYRTGLMLGYGNAVRSLQLSVSKTAISGFLTAPDAILATR